MVNRNFRRPLSRHVVAATVLVTWILTGCNSESSTAAKAPPPVPVVVATAIRKNVAISVEGIGNVEAITSVAVKSRIDGQIIKVGFKDGALVHQGQMLFELDPRPVLAQMKQAEAKVASDSAHYLHAKDQDSRYQELLQKNFISPDAYNQIKANLGSAKAEVAASQAALDNARLMVEYATLRAPISGRAGRVLVPQGNLVKANDTAALATINQISPIYVSFAVAERYLPQIQAVMKTGKSKVDIVASAGNGNDIRTAGELSFVDNSVDAATGTIRLRAAVSNKDAALWPGQFVHALMSLGQQSDVVVVPSDAVQIGPKGNYVFVIDAANKAALREVEVERNAGRESVIGKGLNGGEKVVVDGQSRLAPGAAVEIQQASGKAAEQADKGT
jgi:membrane fusion protein, multidrug efflux system